ncbi:YiiD C-terminal domain-containing protein [Thermithiobacillus plumbiphilus]|uniref:YiiD C-terminal domain-containing protein n=1 Tax=Thermithiobacillus plumbiphilus TaxID=1729899 RepID=A0ABU9D678_9PROT
MPDDKAQLLQTLLLTEIPLTQALQLQVESLDDQGLRLRAPLLPNLNQERSAFAGSLNALVTLAGWGMTWSLISEAGLQAAILIQDSRIQYLWPVHQDFSAFCPPPEPSEAQRFIRALAQKGRARLSLSAEIQADGRLLATFAGRYVATLEPSSPACQA